jgi:hypothetical protein
VGKTVGIGVQHFADTGNVGSSLGGGGSVFASDQHMHIATASDGGGDGVQGGGFDAVVIVFSDDKRAHDGVS